MRVSHQNDPQDAYENVHRQFGWQVPRVFNMAEACCGRWAQSEEHRKRIAIVAHQPGSLSAQSWTFEELQNAATVLSQQ